MNQSSAANTRIVTPRGLRRDEVEPEIRVGGSAATINSCVQKTRMNVMNAFCLEREKMAAAIGLEPMTR